MSKVRVFASFQNILAPRFFGNSAPVLTNLTNPEKWEGLDGTGSLQLKLSYHAALVNGQFSAAILCLKDP